MRKKLFISRFIVGYLFIMICMGCQSTNFQKEDGTGKAIENNVSKLIYDRSQGVSEYKATSPYRIPDDVMEPTQYTETAKHLATIIVDMPEIEKATVLITGNTALIGIELAQELSNEELDIVKQEIREKVQEEEQIYSASVTDSKELVSRMTMIAEDVAKGRPIQGLADEIGVILRRATPTI